MNLASLSGSLAKSAARTSPDKRIVPADDLTIAPSILQTLGFPHLFNPAYSPPNLTVRQLSADFFCVKTRSRLAAAAAFGMLAALTVGADEISDLKAQLHALQQQMNVVQQKPGEVPGDEQ